MNELRGYVVLLIIWSMAAAPLLLAIFRVRRSVFLGITACVGVTAVTAWIAFVAFGYRFSENISTSLNGHIYIYKIGEPWQRGDLIAFRWTGGLGYRRGATFIKRVAGMPGDVVRRDGRRFLVGDQYIGIAKTRTKKGIPLEAAPGGVIPEGEYFVATPNPDSLDSRYAIAGNIKKMYIIGKAHEIF